MREENAALGVSFDLPDIYTGRLRMAFEMRKGFALVTEDDYLPRMWHAGFALIKNWQCAHVTPDMSPDEMTTAEQASAAMWTALRVGAYVRAADDVPKNS